MNPFWEPDSSSVNQGNFHILWQPNVMFIVHNILTFFILNQMNTIHTLPSYLFEIYLVLFSHIFLGLKIVFFFQGSLQKRVKCHMADPFFWARSQNFENYASFLFSICVSVIFVDLIIINWFVFRRAFAKLRKATINFVILFPSAWNNWAPTGLIFMKIYIWVCFENLPRTSRFN